ncbi:MAG: NAD(P)/FAD-dependent oxidoreductase [Thermoplasmatota archaeon]
MLAARSKPGCLHAGSPRLEEIQGGRPHEVTSAANQTWDTVIIGGGAAGLSAALLLGRARRRACVVDAGQQRNLPAKASHSFFTRDGASPAELVTIGRKQLQNYPTVKVIDGIVVSAAQEGPSFRIALASGQILETPNVILAMGVRDLLPDIPGLAACWGNSVFHCPYCHGYEVRDEPLGILLGEADDPIALAQLMRGWSHDLVVFSNGRQLSVQARNDLTARGVQLREERVLRLEGSGHRLASVILEGGDAVGRAALMLRPPQALQSPLASQLGCKLQPDGMILVDQEMQTSVSGVYAAGDCIRRLQQVVFAASDGTMAAMSVNRKLLNEGWTALAPAP